jgi:hypothetical protein
MNTSTPLTYFTETIIPWDWSSGFGYDKEVFTWNIQSIWINEIVNSQAWIVNTGWVLNTYTFDIRFWAISDPNQTGWDYEGTVDFSIKYTY